MTRTELENFYISNVKMYARIIASETFSNCAKAVERLSYNQERLVKEFGYDWEQVEAIEIEAYKAA